MLGDKRPKSISVFETLSVAVLVLEVVFSPAWTWQEAVAAPLVLLIILSVTRGRSRLARWVFSALHACGLVVLIYLITEGRVLLSDVAWTGWVFTLAAILQLILLWLPGTSRWLEASRCGPVAGTQA